MNPLWAIWLAVGISMVAASAMSFTRRDDARGIIRLSASLAAIVLIEPAGGLILTALLTRLFGLRRKGMAQSAGFHALILFMPAVTALALFYLARFQNFDVARLLTGAPAWKF